MSLYLLQRVLSCSTPKRSKLGVSPADELWRPGSIGTTDEFAEPASLGTSLAGAIAINSDNLVGPTPIDSEEVVEDILQGFLRGKSLFGLGLVEGIPSDESVGVSSSTSADCEDAAFNFFRKMFKQHDMSPLIKLGWKSARKAKI